MLTVQQQLFNTVSSFVLISWSDTFLILFIFLYMQIDTRTTVDLVKFRMGNVLSDHLDALGVPVNVVVWQMILPLFISKGSTQAALRLLDVIFFEGSSLPLLAFVLALLEPWKVRYCSLLFLLLHTSIFINFSIKHPFQTWLIVKTWTLIEHLSTWLLDYLNLKH